jgi:phage terminase small subunit
VSELTEKQRAFVLAFTSEPGAVGNASEAARRAGYSEQSARDIGRQLLDKLHVQAAIPPPREGCVPGRGVARW